MSGPLDGITVLDFTVAWAGPMTTRTLAYLGARVIKIESPTTMDSWRGSVRGGAPDRFPDGDPGERPYNRNALFNTQNHDKQSIALNLKRPGAVDVVLALAEHCNVAVANFSPGALDKLGVGYAALSAVNPRLILVEMPAFGMDGPMSHHVGMGKTMEAAAGMTSLIGYGDGEPVPTGPAYLDPIGGLHGAAAVLTALAELQRTGRGQHVEVAQTEAALHWIGEQVLASIDFGASSTPDGNHVADAAPHDAFPCSGEDQWVAVAAFTDEQWTALAELVGPAGLVADPRFATMEARLAHQGELAEVIGVWTRERDKWTVARTLQAAGVPAAPVCDGGDVFADPGLRAAGFVTTLDHPEAGQHPYPGLAYRLTRTPGSMRTAAPLFGQHNDEVLGGLLGMDADRIAELRAAGALADRPAD